MKWLTFDIQKEPGFRINLTDIGFIFFLVVLAVLIRRFIPDSNIFWLPLYLGFSFFLFCNVFRIGNRLEIFWYLPFTAIAAYCLYTMDIELFWFLVLIILEPVKWTLIVYRIRKGIYCGVLSEKITK